MIEQLPTIDFETQAIAPAPNFPPEPVGVSVRLPDLGAVYLAWGHPEGNNCTKQDAYNLLEKVWDKQVGHNSSRFDIPVGAKHFGLPQPTVVHDTIYQLFLHEPLSPNLSLKPSAERLLGWPPEEQDRLKHWIETHIPGISKENPWGAHIAKAPAQIVGSYANGDVNRTWALHEKYYPLLTDRGLLPSYHRELKLAPILNANEAEGIHIDLPRLERDAIVYEYALVKVEAQLVKLLKCDPQINWNSGQQIAAAILASGMADKARWPKTPTGQYSTARDNLAVAITDPRLLQLITYRGPLHTCLSTFIRPWLILARATGGTLHPNWNAVRGDFGGTRTGRLSSYAPNFQNIPTEFEGIEIPAGFPPLPLMRVYVLPRPGERFVKADFHSQEVRILGHFAEGAIKQIYDDDPSADIHEVAAGMIVDATGVPMNRKHVKIIAFTILYGGGINKIAAGLGVDYQTALRMKKAYLHTLTGVEDFQEDVTAIGERGDSVTSWGGRILWAPPGRGYALVNYLIQGSAADQTKEAVNRYGHFYIQVHDEICDSMKPKQMKEGIKQLRWAMEEMGGWDIPMRAEVSVGDNWAQMEKIK